MSHRNTRLIAVLGLLLIPSLAIAQESSLTVEVLDRFVTAHDRERELLTAAAPKLADIDERVRKFRECKTAFEAAGSMSGSRLGGLAARAGIRARCGANSEADITKERREITDKATSDAAAGSGFTVVSYTRLRTRLERIYANGDRAGLSAPEVEAVESRAPRFANIFGIGATSAEARALVDAINSLGVPVNRAGGRVAPGQWTAELSWMYINSMFMMMYGTGANVFDKPYQPGQWTRWRMQGEDEDDTKTIERAYLMATPDGGEWWRFKSISTSREGNRVVADTLVLEGLFKRQGEGTLQLLRMRSKMPGDREPNEMMVPQNMSTVNTLGMYGAPPTAESIEGATMGTETIRTPAGSFSAKRVRFSSPEGRADWWITDQVPGGWIKYRASESDSEVTYVMELIAHGTGAKSELGVR
jgi:hypothetical protein